MARAVRNAAAERRLGQEIVRRRAAIDHIGIIAEAAAMRQVKEDRRGGSTRERQTQPGEHRSSRLQGINWNDIQRPGRYLILGSGDLVRVPQDSLAPGRSPLITITSSAETRVARLSDNPAEPLSVLRSFTADNDYFVDF